MFPLAVVLAAAALRADGEVWLYALPLSLFGGAIALYHSLLYMGLLPQEIEPCGEGPSCSSAEMTILGGVPLPVLSLAAFSTIAVLLLLIRRGTSNE